MAIQRQTILYDGPGGPFEGVVVSDSAWDAPRPGVMIVPNVLGAKEQDSVVGERLAALGWVEGVHTGLAPRWSVAGAPDVHAVPFLGNAGLTQAATPLLRKARAATRVQIAAQEPEFNRVRALAQRLASLYEDATPVAACAPPIAEWQCLFQRLAQHEYPLHTGITDYLGSAVLATAALLEVGEPAHPLLGQVASGERIATLLVPFTASPTRAFAPVVTVDGDRLTGSVAVVADALAADVLVVPTASGLYAVAASAATIDPATSLDMTRQLADVRLDGAAGTPLGGDAPAAVRAALTVGAAMLACEMLGVAQNALDTAVAYMKQRYQFGRLIASYQALKHRMADVYVAVSQLQAAAKYAAACAGGSDPDLPIAAAVAKAHASVTAVLAAQECLQMHGGQGMTWENPSHLMLKRAKADSLALGRADAHRAWLGELIALPA